MYNEIMATKNKKSKSTVAVERLLKPQKPKKKLAPDDPRMLNLKKAVHFKKGFDPRRNLDGPIRNQAWLTKYIQALLDQKTDAGNTYLSNMLLSMILSQSSGDHVAILQYGYGKIADEIVFSMDDIKKIIGHLPPDMIEKLAKGESISDILIQYITSHSDGTSSPE